MDQGIGTGSLRRPAVEHGWTGIVYERLAWPLAAPGGRIVQLIEIVTRRSILEAAESFSSRVVVPSEFS